MTTLIYVDDYKDEVIFKKFDNKIDLIIYS